MVALTVVLLFREVLELAALLLVVLSPELVGPQLLPALRCRRGEVGPEPQGQAAAHSGSEGSPPWGAWAGGEGRDPGHQGHMNAGTVLGSCTVKFANPEPRQGFPPQLRCHLL